MTRNRRATQLEKQRDRWNSELERLEKRASSMEAEVEREYERQVERLRRLLEESEEKLSQIKAARSGQIPKQQEN